MWKIQMLKLKTLLLAWVLLINGGIVVPSYSVYAAERYETNSQSSIFTLSDWTYEENSKYIILDRYTGTDENLIIPAIINRKEVHIKSLQDAFPNNIKTIQFKAIGSAKVKLMQSSLSYALSSPSYESLDLRGLDTSNVRDMSHMFSESENLITVRLAGLNTWQVTNMSYMFQGCKKLETIDCYYLNTYNVTDMSYMFSQCESLKFIDFSILDSTNVTNMSGMFYQCKSLQNAHLESMKTSNVTSMTGMFTDCVQLKQLDIGNWDVSNVTNMSLMFYNCASLEELDITKWNIKDGTDQTLMMSGCNQLPQTILLTLDQVNGTIYNDGFDSVKISAKVIGTNEKVRFESLDANVVEVDVNGNVTPVSEGSALIQVSVENVMAFFKVEVMEPQVTLNYKKATLYTKGTSTNLQLKASVIGRTQDVKYKSSAPSIATVNTSGKVTAKKAGTAIITVTANGVSTTCKIVVKSPTLTVKKTTVTIRKGKTSTIKAKATPARKISYTSKNKKIATVSSKGVIKGIRAGKTTITVTCNGVTKKVTVVVKG